MSELRHEALGGVVRVVIAHHVVVRDRVIPALLIIALVACWLVVLAGSAALVVWGP